jgi:L-lactate utilization protein LutC
MSREAMLGRVRQALGRTAGAPVPAPPSVWLHVPEMPVAERLDRFTQRFEALNGKVHRVETGAEARACVAELLAGRAAVASNAAYLQATGIAALGGVVTGFREVAALKQACAEMPVGITSVDYALAETGTFVMIASPEESRLVSLLPPMHIAVVPASRMLVNLDELLTRVPLAAEQTSSLVLITGPSRTADIEQILVRGVHGPGEIHAVLVAGE